jgi:plastocyanin
LKAQTLPIRAIGLYLLTLIFSFIFSFYCAKVNPTAPDGSILYVSANPPSIPSGGSQSIITVIGYEATGIPLSNGTVIYFACDIGSIDDKAITHDGKTNATFISDSRSGTAHVSVTSGNCKGNIEILVGSAALASLSIGAIPAVLPHEGGSSTITVVAFDKYGNTLSDIPVVFSTTAGTLKSGGSALYTDIKGQVQDILTTSKEATVTATSGTINASTKIEIEAANKPPTAAFVYSPLSPTVGEKVYFNASESADSDGVIVSYEWDFGDGSSGSGQKASHSFAKEGSYKVTLVVTDDDGAKGVASQTVTVSETSLSTANY